MRAVEITQDRKLVTVEREPGLLRDHDVRVAVSYAGICGSDLHNIVMPHVTPAGTVLGHEFSGVVVELGAAVTRLAVGDRVAVLPFEYCGVCATCRAGSPQVCVDIRATKVGGAFRPGAFAESVVTPAASAHELPDAVSDAHAALAEPLAVGIHAVAVSEVSPDEPVAVVGGGPIGIATTLALKARGFTSIAGVEPNAPRRARLGTFGIPTTGVEDAAATVPQLLGGTAPTAVFDCTGHPSGPSTALALLPTMGRLIVLGSTVEPASFDFYKIVRDEIRVRGAVCYTHDEFREAIEQLAAGNAQADDLITAVHDLDDAQACFDDLRSGRSEHLKVLLTP
jgi:(R,R)-butanediol dehydrogenase/meso-butanediol dehydrogenase/diacetyl reductase